MSNFTFILSRKNQAIGQIAWFCGGDDGNGALQGDKNAVKQLQDAIELAIQEEWECAYPRPYHIVVHDPLNYIDEMVTVLEQAGFDMPIVLYPYTAQAQKEQREKDKQILVEDPPPFKLRKCH